MKDSMRAKIWMFFVILAAGFIAVSLGLDCPQTSVAPTPQEADPNLVNFKLLCVKRVVEGRTTTAVLSACDPDEDDIAYRLLQAPEGMTIEQGGGETYITWLAEYGVWYVDVEVYDIPQDPNDSLTDRGSLVFIVRRANQAPIFGGCR